MLFRIKNKLVSVQNRLYNIYRNKLSTTSSTVINDSNVVNSDYSDIFVPDITLQELIHSACNKFSNKIAIECAVTKKAYTFEQIRSRSINLNKSLRKNFKLAKGDVVAVLLPNSPEYPVTILGNASAGLISTTINPIYTPEEISNQIKDSGAKVMVTQSSYYDKVRQAIALVKAQIPVLTIKENASESLPRDAINFEEFAASKIEDIPFIQARSTDVAILPYSSGTTGLPKGVELLHSNLVGNLLQSSHPSFLVHQPTTETHQDILPLVLPMYHLYGFGVLMLNLMNGSRCVSLPKFTPDTFISALKDYKITHLYAAPPLVIFLTNSDEVKPEYLSHLKSMYNGAAPLGYSDEIRFKEKFNTDIFVRQGYGLTETALVVSITPIGTKTTSKIGGSIGKLVSNTSVKVINPDDPLGRPLGIGERGELLIKGPQVMKGYHKRPEETKKAFLDGWFRTGDMVYYDENKFFFVTDRIKELIKVKGYQVPPAELEAVIRSFPGVEDAGVIGIPHPKNGEAPRAYIVVKKGQNIKPEDVQSYVASKVAKYKQLTGGVQLMESIPKNPSGKILRRKLKEQYLSKGV